MHVKKGDKVVIISGKDKGKQGEVLQAFPKNDRVTIKGLNVVKKHVKPNNEYPEGTIIEVEAPIHVSNVMHVDPKTGEPTRIGRKFQENKDGQNVKVRYAKKSGEIID